jgi:choline-sulfatase
MTEQIRRCVVSFALLTLVLIGVDACAPKSRPNVLLITIDTLRADHLGCYGFTGAKTPIIDAVAAQGVRCTDAAAVAPITLPSHCSILTGLYPPAHGVRDNGAYALGDNTVTLQERLHSEGYATKAIVSAVVLNRRYNLAKGFDDYDDDLWAEDEPELFLVRDRKAPKTAARFLTWLDRWQKTPDHKPFFAWVHFYDPHAPYEPPLQDKLISPSPYDGEIAVVDRAVGQLVAALRDSGELEGTVLVITADHGESLGEHQEKTHALFIYDATIRVPLIWRYPAAFPANTTYGGAVSSVDIVPTILGLLRVSGGDQTQGVNLLRPLQGKTPPPERAQYCESLLSEVGFGMAPLYGVRLDGFKWIRAPKPEVYDLRRDRNELVNIVADAQPTAVRLDHELQVILDDSQQHEHKANESPMDHETMQALRSLGYLAGAQERASMGGMDPKDGIGIYNQLEDARHLAQRHRWSEAEQALRDILAKTPTHLTARNILGLVLLRQGKAGEAKAEYLESLRQDPKQSRLWAAISTVHMVQGDLVAAEDDLKHALAVTPHYVEAICGMGFLAALREDDAKAREWYDKAVAEDPGFPRVHRRVADLYYERGDFAAALQNYQRALKVTPDDFAALMQAGNCKRHIGDRDGAAQYFEHAARLRVDSWIPPYNLGCLAAVNGQADKAITHLTAAASNGLRDAGRLKTDPDWDGVRKLPGFIKLQQQMEVASARPGVRSDDDWLSAPIR